MSQDNPAIARPRLTHFIPHALEHGFTEFQASSALGLMGAMNVLGTVGSGWLCDRVGRRGPLAVYYGVRGLSLLFLVAVWDVRSLHVWAAIFGLNFISTVPPAYLLAANIFGPRSVGELSGWVFFSHQVGGALGAARRNSGAHRSRRSPPRRASSPSMTAG